MERTVTLAELRMEVRHQRERLADLQKVDVDLTHLLALVGDRLASIDQHLAILTLRFDSLDKCLIRNDVKLDEVEALAGRAETVAKSADETAQKAQAMAWKASALVGTILAGGTSAAHSLWSFFQGGGS